MIEDALSLVALLLRLGARNSDLDPKELWRRDTLRVEERLETSVIDRDGLWEMLGVPETLWLGIEETENDLLIVGVGRSLSDGLAVAFEDSIWVWLEEKLSIIVSEPLLL